MKKVLLSILTLGIIGFMSSCSKTDDAKPAPSVTLTSSGSAAATGTTVVVGYTVTTGENLSSIIIKKVVGTSTSNLSEKTTGFDEKTKHTDAYAYTVSETSGLVTIRIEATDSKSASTYQDYVITVGGVVAFNSALENSSISLTSNRAATLASSSNGSFYSISSKSTGTSSLSSSDFRLLDKNGSTSGTAFMFLTSTSATNATKFSSTSLSYETATAADVNNASTPTGEEVPIAAGNTYLFVTSLGKKGLVKVESLSDVTVSAGGTTKNAILKLKTL